ncbi:hypothetical protein MPER_09533 [Moniliophthora perniciosa FA553]|nr:hypothetical protein MPER_09533 [Moniliophthora perniciosa FA553]
MLRCGEPRTIVKLQGTGPNDNLTMLAHWQCQVDGLPMLHIDYTIPMDWITNNLLCETSGLSATSPHVLTVNITIQDPQTQMFWFDKIEYAPGSKRLTGGGSDEI